MIYVYYINWADLQSDAIHCILTVYVRLCVSMMDILLSTLNFTLKLYIVIN